MTLRLPASVLARYEALGEGWRSKAEAVLVAHVAPRAEVAAAAKGVAKVTATGLQIGPVESVYGSRLKKR